MSNAIVPTGFTSERGAMTVHEFCAWATISAASFYREVTAGRITIRKIGRKSVVTMPDAKAWLDTLPTANNHEAA